MRLPESTNGEISTNHIQKNEYNTKGPIGHVLLIDDSPVAAKVAAKVLETFQLGVTTANSAKAGFDLLKANPRKYCVVFLDVVMPKVDGVETLSWIKDDPDISHTPVYMLSGLEDATLAEVCIERGAEGMLTKPLNANILINILPNLDTQYDPSKNTGNITRSGGVSGGVYANSTHAVSLNAQRSLGVEIGRQADAFQLLDSDDNEFRYPSPTSRQSLFVAVVSTIFLPNIFEPGSLLTRLKDGYSSIISAKTDVLCITSDLPSSLHQAKNSFAIPFKLLSDPHCRYQYHRETYIITNDLSQIF